MIAQENVTCGETHNALKVADIRMQVDTFGSFCFTSREQKQPSRPYGAVPSFASCGSISILYLIYILFR